MLKLRNVISCCSLVGLSPCCSSPPASLPNDQAVMSSKAGNVMDVELFMHSNQRPGQVASVQGVVARVDAPKQMLALIDKAEFEECSTTTCAALYLPVRWQGTMPAEKDVVVAEGKIATEGDKLVFVATAIEKRSANAEKKS